MFQAASIPFDAYDRESMAGRARALGLKAGGEPTRVPGLANPDVPAISNNTATMEDSVLPMGYPLETYPVETSDGFILRVYRIPHGKKNATGTGPKPVVLLHHGVTLASNCWVVLDPDSSMGFYLADAGFDVWMANTRGNTFSRGHKKWKATERMYWENSMDELALIDLPAQIDFILDFTKQPKLAIVGHSQGCTLTLMMLSWRADYNDKLWLMMLMGPVANSMYIKTPFLAQQAKTGSSLLLSMSGIGQFIPNYATSQLVSGCTFPVKEKWCFDLVNFMFYGPSIYVSSDDFKRCAATWPAGVSTRNLIHWSQMYHTRNGIYMYDFGENCSASWTQQIPFEESCNQAKYGFDTPLMYDVGKVTAPAALFEGADDLMGTKEDAAVLVSQWSSPTVFRKIYPKTAHMDFVWARRPIMKPDALKVLWDNAPKV
ncbi:MAG: Alpha/Beta hydrolase protein [Monoraphidium minutum]|nr:MAG: Alpha/Beta hydrolase protein [Monoraphidium minutum]